MGTNEKSTNEVRKNQELGALSNLNTSSIWIVCKIFVRTTPVKFDGMQISNFIVSVAQNVAFYVHVLLTKNATTQYKIHMYMLMPVFLTTFSQILFADTLFIINHHG